MRSRRGGGAYASSQLPTLALGPPAPPQPLPQQQFEALTKLYGEVCTTWRALVTVRFALLGLVPAVSAGVMLTLLSQQGVSQIAKTGFVVFAALVTLGLYVYERRNSELHDDLISRGRRIEEELGIDTGQFRGRPGGSKWLAWLFPVEHDIAINLIYGAALLAWLLALWWIWFGAPAPVPLAEAPRVGGTVLGVQVKDDHLAVEVVAPGAPLARFTVEVPKGNSIRSGDPIRVAGRNAYWTPLGGQEVPLDLLGLTYPVPPP